MPNHKFPYIIKEKRVRTIVKNGFVRNAADAEPFCPPLHENCDAWALIDPSFGGGDSVELHITEMRPGGAALEDVHENKDHIFYVLSGKGYALVDGERHPIQTGDALWIARKALHEIHVEGRETLRLLVVIAPAK